MYTAVPGSTKFSGSSSTVALTDSSSRNVFLKIFEIFKNLDCELIVHEKATYQLCTWVIKNK